MRICAGIRWPLIALGVVSITLWASATVLDCSDYHLFAQLAPLKRGQAELKPVGIVKTNGAWLVDFGRCIDGWPKLKMRANHPGEVVRAEYFQRTDGRKPSAGKNILGTAAWRLGTRTSDGTARFKCSESPATRGN